MDCQENLDLDEYITFTLRNPITDRRLRRLCDRLDRAFTSTELVAAVRAIARTRHPQAVEILGAILDSGGPVGRAAVKGLIGFGARAQATEVLRIVGSHIPTRRRRTGNRHGQYDFRVSCFSPMPLS
jgi:hypothetical protein